MQDARAETEGAPVARTILGRCRGTRRPVSLLARACSIEAEETLKAKPRGHLGRITSMKRSTWVVIAVVVAIVVIVILATGVLGGGDGGRLGY
jgi:hypothetical protein